MSEADSILTDSIRNCVLRKLRGRLRLIGAPPTIADDALQEACVRFLELSEARHWDENRIVVWLSIVAWNCLIDEYRHQRNCIPLTVNNAANAAVLMDVEGTVLSHVAWESALNGLSPEDRALLHRKEEGLTNPEIADKLNLPVETIKKRFQRATERFRKQLVIQGIEIPVRDFV